jgi:hypothetical protein
VSEFSRRDDETVHAWFVRLKAVPASGLSDQQMAHWLRCLPAARDAATRGLQGDDSESPLERIKRDTRTLTDEDRRRLVGWIADGMPDD